MKTKFILSLILIFAIGCEISTNLWKEEMITNISQVNYINEDDFIVYSDRGIVSRLNNRGETLWKKNLIYPKKCKIITDSQCIYSIMFR